MSCVAINQILVSWPHVWRTEADNMRLSCMCSLLRLRQRYIRTFAIVAEVQPLLMSTTVQLIKALGGTEAAICSPRL